MTVLLLLLVLLLVLVNGFFVAAEFAVVRSRPSRLQAIAEEGDKRATIALGQIERMDEFVASSQVGITLASIGIGFLGEPAIAHLIEPMIEGVVGEAVSFGDRFGDRVRDHHPAARDPGRAGAEDGRHRRAPSR